MKEVIEKVEREVVKYEAADGTRFSDKKECQIYEESAAVMLLAKLMECEVARQYDHDWFDASEDNEYRTLVPKTQEHIDALNQLYFMFGGKCTDKPKFSKEDIGTFILLGYRYNGDNMDWVWLYKFDIMIADMTGGKYRAEMVKI
jgi:hypothetical protein